MAPQKISKGCDCLIEYLYHGSCIAGIEKINAKSLLHGTSDTKVVYLTDIRPYSLFYIWDADHNIKQGKHVTSWIKDGIVYYEEQFSNQLAEFYKGVCGYLYCVEKNDSFNLVKEHESMWYSEKDAHVSKVETIYDVYSEIKKYESKGHVRIKYFNDVPAERINALYNRMAENIVKQGLLSTPNTNDAKFYQTFFKQVWELAVKIKSFD